jgi:hypothetical protein
MVITTKNITMAAHMRIIATPEKKIKIRIFHVQLYSNDESDDIVTRNHQRFMQNDLKFSKTVSNYFAKILRNADAFSW